jgi:SAM-dependent MidA family methyltransferase
MFLPQDYFMYHPLPNPTAQQLQHSAALSERIALRIQQAPNHVISFSDYMELALYTPELGYYMSEQAIFGKEGDFITAPEISPLFAQCLARPCAQVLEKTHGNILEIGAGSGKLAAELLRSLPELPKNYFIYEISPALRRRQQLYLQQTIPDIYPRIHWLDELPKQFTGVIIANEVIDALPTDCFAITENQILGRGVTQKDQQFVWENYLPTEELQNAVKEIQNTLDIPMFPDYTSEISLRLSAWLKELSTCLQSGVILLMDYGFERHEFYHPERSEGTLMCHYRQHAHDNPFWHPGLQDITVNVDFTRVAEEAIKNNLEVLGFSAQAHFLLACGLLDIFQAQPELTYALKQQIHWLTSPAEMGERFKVMALAKQCDIPLLGFQEYLAL